MLVKQKRAKTRAKEYEDNFMRAHALELFRATFHTTPTHAASAPGRVNLIGEHTDYNGGPVLPMAIGSRTVAVVAPGESGWLDLVSERDGHRHHVRWDQTLPPGWPAYVVGVMRELATRGCAPSGARLAVASDVPAGGGLSSSAALTVSTGRALAALAGVRLSAATLIDVAYRAEHDHVGVRCGIMDQTIVVRARSGHALLLECATGRTRQVPVRARFLLADTGVRHALGTSPYNTRRAECESARVELARALPGLVHLADWPLSRLRDLRRLLPEPLRSRATHVVTETARTREAATLLARGRLRAFGRLLFASHESCRRDYACSAPELDVIVRAARRAGAWGARLTGAGWGGAVLVVVGPERLGDGPGERRIVDGIRRAFVGAYGREPGIQPVRAGAGARSERVR
jgi:galactokinase